MIGNTKQNLEAIDALSDLLSSGKNVLQGNAVSLDGRLYDDTRLGLALAIQILQINLENQ